MLRATIASLLAIASTGSALAQTQDTVLRNDSDASHASADQIRQEFSIAAQPVSQALRAYAQQSGDQVVFYSPGHLVPRERQYANFHKFVEVFAK